uniref:Putative ovule protein n=1 Tax=Solanum chacoense TaxID=4108 RepID=A0A0V0HGZ4_SOLCH
MLVQCSVFLFLYMVNLFGNQQTHFSFKCFCSSHVLSLFFLNSGFFFAACKCEHLMSSQCWFNVVCFYSCT